MPDSLLRDASELRAGTGRHQPGHRLLPRLPARLHREDEAPACPPGLGPDRRHGPARPRDRPPLPAGSVSLTLTPEVVGAP